MRRFLIAVAMCAIGVAGCSKSGRSPSAVNWKMNGKTTALPQPETRGGMPLSAAIAARRSRREFTAETLTAAQISQLCWAAQGITDAKSGKRAAPSAGALYPITVLVVDARGVFEYQPRDHSLVQRGTSDVRRKLQAAALDQTSVGNAPACMVIGMNVQVIAAKYGGSAEQYCRMEAGHVAQNVLLTAVSLQLAGVPVGAFHERKVAGVLQLPSAIRPVYLIPLGHPATG